MTPRVAWVALSLVSSLGPRRIRRMVQMLGGVEQIYSRLEELRGTDLLTSQQWKTLERQRAHEAQIEELLYDWQAQGVTIVTEDDDAYPQNLRGLPDGPGVLYVLGGLRPEDRQALAVVGTRSPTEAGEKTAYDLGRALAERGYTVVSGMALGVDTLAHLGALEGGGRTLAVLGSGVLNPSPKENTELAPRIQEQGATLSEFHPYQTPATARFMLRNRVQAGLSLGVIVVEARARGGSHVTARRCVEYGRHLFAVRWREEKPEAEGTEILMSELGAIAIESLDALDEALAQLSEPFVPPALPTQRALFEQGEERAGRASDSERNDGDDP